MKYAFIREHRFEHRVEKMCRVLEVSRSGYYRWLARPLSKTAQENLEMTAMIRKVHKDKKKSNYGSPRITAELHKQGYHCSEARVARIMRKEGIVAARHKKFKVTTDANHHEPIALNLLDQIFETDKPNKVWVSDITYVRTREHWMYVTVVIDLFGRRVVGWSMSNSLKASETTVAALEHACKREKPVEELIFHSDRGIQYACEEFRALLGAYDFTQSMSGKGNCYDNAVAESFFKTLKSECVYQYSFSTCREARTVIFDYIETFYNKQRLHSSLGNISPDQYVNNYYAKDILKHVA
ncbi:IS3 family transposase [Acinetobacter sp.]|uniref:IS3 family transposase n=1 Tax=Acinetobacter sp. TaxID=472 RepID=UPI003D0700A6